MKPSHVGVAVVAGFALVAAVFPCPGAAGRAADGPAAGSGAGAGNPALTGSAIAAVLDANGGKVPATGEELWRALGKLDKFSQLPVAFSAVRLDSGLANPRVVITPHVTGLSQAEVTGPNLAGRLFLAANMERGANGTDPRVTSVEFISWNTSRRRFDFGVIEDMGGDGEPQLRVVDGGKCFACHKNRGPILGGAPWTNTAHFPGVHTLVAGKLKLVEAVPAGAAGVGLRDRIDGMALVAPEAVAVDNAVRLGSLLRLNREVFRLMNRSPGGRRAFVTLLVAITAPGPLDPNDRQTKQAVDTWDDSSYLRFATDWVALTKATNSGVLADHASFKKVQLQPKWGQKKTIQPIPQPPPGGFRTASEALAHERKVKEVIASNEAITKAIATQMEVITTYDAARAEGRPGLPSAYQPSNPKAFIPAPSKAAPKPSSMVNAVMLAGTIGLTEGDRKFLARSLAEAAERVNKPKVTVATLAKQVFEGSQFADVLEGGPLPDRDEFKDRFVAGLHEVLKTTHQLAGGFVPARREYASGPRYDPNSVEEKEVAVVPTTSCLRCHEIRGPVKTRTSDLIPVLAFDPFDKAGREAWVKAAAADPKRKQEVLARLAERLFEDKDMPPEDAPEHDLFRVKQSAAFDELKTFLAAESAKAKAK
jgi:nitrate reductase cytochrome c-type subunit